LRQASMAVAGPPMPIGHKSREKDIRMKFRAVLLSFLLSFSITSAARAEIQILAPPVVSNAGLKTIATAFTQKTGIAVAIRSLELLKIAENATAQPTDIVLLTSSL